MGAMRPHNDSPDTLATCLLHCLVDDRKPREYGGVRRGWLRSRKARV